MKKFFEDFRDFIVQGNALNLAIGVVIGGAFGAIVNSLVQDIIMPPIGLLLGKVDFSNLYFLLSPSDTTFNSLAEAQAYGAVVIAYGKFIMAIVSFLIIAFVIFILLRAINKAREKAEEKLKLEKKKEEATTKVCPFCATDIPLAASRCPHCTSQLES
jgi:large conductance mechanosensitive channel